MFHDYRLFFRQFRENFHTTGSIAPSSRWLAKALARHVPGNHAPGRDTGIPDSPRRILEVGPGTGAVTRQIVRVLGPHDRFDLVELNDEFVARLRHLFDAQAPFSDVAERVRIFHQGVETLTAGQGYDAIVSGLPLNNFSGELVERLLAALVGLLAPGGTLSFFEYVAVRSAKRLVSRGSERTRLQAVSKHLDRLLSQHEFQRQCVLRNLPPAWVHHVRTMPQPTLAAHAS